VPDSDSRLGRLLRPQHQHFAGHDNLCAEIEERGFTIVASHRGGAHIPVDRASASGSRTRVIAKPPCRT
jgi:hypothetical protein